ncbi:helix-turn-helix transcriptional regulator [Lactiplantibacillus paraxiangfangensis]|uniref:helix-turn-helix domain-containing protein n=1 Tax=Lactiplantibacillus paraxiangfangensis TaxID=3076224 RepID=UPI0030C7816C
MTNNKSEVGQRIKTLRQANHFSMATLAAMVGVAGKSTINDWEKGRTHPHGERLVKIAQALETSVSFLQHGDLHDYVFNVLKNDGLNNPEFNVLLWEYVDLTTTNPGILSGDVFNSQAQEPESSVVSTDIDPFIDNAINQVLPAVLRDFSAIAYPEPSAVINSACDRYRKRIQLIRRTFTGKYNRIIRLLDNVDLYEKLGDDPALVHYLNATTDVTGGYDIDRHYQQKMNALITTFHQQLNGINAEYQASLKKQRQTKTNSTL